MRLAIAALLLCCSGPTNAAKRTQGVGLICTASDGSVLRLNIDLKRERFDAGEGQKSLYSISDTKIEIEGPNRYMASDPDPYFHTVELNRASLVLSDLVLAPNRGIRREKLFQCVVGPLIDFTLGRKL